MTSPLRQGIWLTLTLLLATTVVACSPSVADDPATQPPDDTALEGREPGGGGSDGDPGAGQAPDDPVVGGPGAADGQPPQADGALRVEPRPGVLNPRPHAWDHIAVAPDGKTITVYYWGGVEDCYALAGVDVQRDANGLLAVTVLEGQRGDLAPDTVCIEIALLKSVEVTLDDLLVVPSQ